MPVPDMIFCNTCSISASFVGFPKKAHRNKTGTFCAQTPQPLSFRRHGRPATAVRQAAFRSAHNLRPIITDNIQARNAPVLCGRFIEKSVPVKGLNRYRIRYSLPPAEKNVQQHVGQADHNTYYQRHADQPALFLSAFPLLQKPRIHPVPGSCTAIRARRLPAPYRLRQ